MIKNKTKLQKALKAATATTWQTKAALILLKVNGVENALRYVKQINRRNKKED